MRRPGLLTLLLSLLLPLIAQAQDTPVTTRSSAPNPADYRLVEIVSGLTRPLYVTHAGDESERLFVVEQGGRIWILQNGILQSQPFLDVSSLVSRDANERGLLGLAFHPDHAQNGYFFINYTDVNGDTVVARYSVSADDPNVADTNSAVTLLQVDQPYGNHNGGHLVFGPDGYLYIGLGDGGSQNDPQGNGQNPHTLLGSILRIDVDSEGGYSIPDDNPFADGTQGAPEVWAYGLRNPWRFTFDRATGDLYIADVGQNRYEEVNFEPADSPGGVNYGWNIYEGRHPFTGSAAPANMVLPVAEYDHSQGISVTGGYVYRGEELPDLQGVYFYADYATGRIWGLYRDANGNWQNVIFRDSGLTISSFGEDEAGELYIVDHGGRVFRLEGAN